MPGQCNRRMAQARTCLPTGYVVNNVVAGANSLDRILSGVSTKCRLSSVVIHLCCSDGAQTCLLGPVADNHNPVAIRQEHLQTECDRYCSTRGPKVTRASVPVSMKETA